MAYPTKPSGVVPQVAAAVSSFGVSAVEFSAAAALLGKGVLVVYRPYSKGGSAPQDGHLRFERGNSLTFEPVTKKKRPPKQGPTATTVSSIDRVELQEQDRSAGENICRILLKEGAAGSSFSFQCAADAKGFSRCHLTKCVAAVLNEPFVPTQKKGELLDKARRMTTFAELLEPLGLVDKYDSKFQRCGILFENLSIVTREDLIEVLGITDRVDQINILGQIKRCFLDPPPERQLCRCSRSDGGSAGQLLSSGTGTAAAEVAAEVIGALAGL